MRTKALILTAAVSAAGIASSMGQVFSQNGVGYYNLDLPSGFSLIANQFNNGDNNLNTIIPDAPVGSQILKFNSGTQMYESSVDFFGAAFGGWVDPLTFAPTDVTLSPGEGAFINLAAPAVLTLVGEIPQGSIDVGIDPLFSIIAHGTPQSVGVNATGLPASVGDQILFWDNAAQAFEGSLDYFGPAFGGWVDPITFAPVDPTPDVGEAMFYNSAAAGPVNWNRTFSIN